MSTEKEYDRRRFLKTFAIGGIAGAVVSQSVVRTVFAMGDAGHLVEGVRKVQGPVAVNGAPAQVGSLVFPGDIITTGKGGMGAFVIGMDAFLVRENSRIELIGDQKGSGPGATKLVTTLKIAAGRVLSVFGKGQKRIETVTAIAGTRGTGMYIEAEEDVTYCCLCYGKADLDARAFPGERESMESRHHEYAYYVLPKGFRKAFLRAPMINHTDAELTMLESLVGRTPPFGAEDMGIRKPGY